MSNLLKQAATFNAGFSQENQPANTVDVLRLNVVYCSLAKILDNPYQPRQMYEPAHILDIATSLRDNKSSLPDTLGLQQVPAARVGLLVEGKFVPADKLLYSEAGELRRLLARPDAAVQLCFGHSRKRAFTALATGVESVFPGKLDATATELAAKLTVDPDYARMPIRLAYADNEQMWQHALTENGKRKDINPLEEAVSIQTAIAEFGYTYERAAEFFGYQAKGTVGNKIRLLDLPDEAKDALRTGQISERHARTLVALKDDPKVLKTVLKNQLGNSWNVAKLEDVVKWERKNIDAKAAEQKEWAAARAVLNAGWVPPGSIAPLPADRMVEHSYNQRGFNSPQMHRLLNSGHCTTACKCMAVSYRSWNVDPESIHPDPQNAPHIELVCTNSGCLGEKLRLIPNPDEQKRKAQQAEEERKEQEIEQAARVEWEKRLRKVDLVNLWNDIRFWIAIASENNNAIYHLRNIEETDTIATVQSSMLDLLFRSCRDWERNSGGYAYKTDRMDRIVGLLTRPITPPAQPAPGDSQSTNWQATWTDDDEDIYYHDLHAEDDTFRLNWVRATQRGGDESLTPALLLRLIEEAGDKAIRGQLWRIHNQIAPKEEDVPEL